MHPTNAFHWMHSGLLKVAELISIGELHHARLFHCSIPERKEKFCLLNIFGFSSSTKEVTVPVFSLNVSTWQRVMAQLNESHKLEVVFT